MRDAVHYAVLVSIAAAFPALAQTAAPPAGVTSNGIVTLGTGTSASAAFPAISVAPTAASQATSGTTTGGSATGGASSTSGTAAGASGSPSGTPAVTGSTSSSRAGSGGSSGGAATAPSISVPAWVLCPPSGASGIQPFLAGTDLSCAP